MCSKKSPIPLLNIGKQIMSTLIKYSGLVDVERETILPHAFVLVAGDDAGIPLTRFDRFWLELEAMTAGGMTNMQAMVAATKTAATAMGRLEEIGSISVGKQADIIAVASNPCQDISALANPIFVMRSGRIYRQ